jgi:hypothetical protein
MENRPLSKQEQKLLEVLIKKAKLDFPQMNDKLLAQPVKDGNMGGLRLVPDGIKNETRLFGNMASELEFTDEDGITVIASLNIDTNGNLFELDIWKTDFSPLIRIPDSFE